jgi:membrane-bound metal-dependent hydrolase YbcI (DUF457 family)
MMAEQHIRSGVLGGLLLLATGAQMLDVVSLTDSLMVPVIAGGAAILPDWDHERSTVTRIFPLVTRPIHWLVVGLHMVVYAATRRGGDPPTFDRSPHRGLTHSLVVAVSIIPLLAAVLYALPAYACAILLIFLVLLCGDVFFAPLVLILYVSAGLWEFGPLGFLAHVHSLWWLWSLAVGIGCVAHILGDCPTSAGAPLFAPLSWEPVILPFTFRTGGTFERRVVKVALIIAIAWVQYLLHRGWIAPAIDSVVALLKES